MDNHINPALCLASYSKIDVFKDLRDAYEDKIFFRKMKWIILFATLLSLTSMMFLLFIQYF